MPAAPASRRTASSKLERRSQSPLDLLGAAAASRGHEPDRASSLQIAK